VRRAYGSIVRSRDDVPGPTAVKAQSASASRRHQGRSRRSTPWRYGMCDMASESSTVRRAASTPACSPREIRHNKTPGRLVFSQYRIPDSAWIIEFGCGIGLIWRL
jgi:hypothetical protein